MNLTCLIAVVGLLLANSCAVPSIARAKGLTSAQLPGHSTDRPRVIQAPAELTSASISRMTTAELARLLLPDQSANRFVSHELSEPIFPGAALSAVRFFARPVPDGNDLCRRDVTHVNLDPNTQAQDDPLKVVRTHDGVQIAAAPRCRVRAGGFFGWVQPARAYEGATRALRRLLSLQRAAQSRDAFATQVTCRNETWENPCNGPPRDLLADLPIHQIFIIEPRGDGWEFAIMPNGHQANHWDVLLTPEGASKQQVDLIWRVTAPF